MPAEHPPTKPIRLQSVPLLDRVSSTAECKAHCAQAEQEECRHGRFGSGLKGKLKVIQAIHYAAGHVQRGKLQYHWLASELDDVTGHHCRPRIRIPGVRLILVDQWNCHAVHL